MYRITLFLFLSIVAFVESGFGQTVSFTFVESGSDVLFIGEGSIDTSGLSVASMPTVGEVAAGIGDTFFFVGSGDFLVQHTDPAATGQLLLSEFEPVIGASADDPFGSGDTFGIDTTFGLPVLFLPDGFVSDTFLSGSITFPNSTISTLGLTAGSEANFLIGTNEITLSVSDPLVTAPSIPEPTSFFVLLAGMSIGALRRHRNK